MPKHNANFGAGQSYGYRIIRGVDVADLDADGKKEVLAATSGQLLVALNSNLEKRWAIRLATARMSSSVNPWQAP